MFEQTCWIISTWEESNPIQLCEIFNALSQVDWKSDSFIWFGNGDAPNPIVLKHIEQYQGKKLVPDHGSPCFQYYLPAEEAIALQLE